MAGPQCCSNPPTLDPNSGEGHMDRLGGLSSYVTGNSKTKLAIVIISDIYGTYTHLPLCVTVYFR